MKRDISIPASLIYILGYWGAGMIVNLPAGFSEATDSLSMALVIFNLVVVLRILFFCFQTLIHSWKHSDPPSRVAWIIGHFLFGPIVSFVYYFLTYPPKNVPSANKPPVQAPSTKGARE